MLTAAVIGELCEDILMHEPGSVDVMGQKVWAKDIVVTAGGSAFYTGAALARMGVGVKICSTLGQDAAGERILAAMRRCEIDCAGVKLLPKAATTGSIVVCDGAKKDFVGCSPMLPLFMPKWEDICGADLLYLAGYTIYPEFWSAELFLLCKKARAAGMLVAVDSQLLPVETTELARLCCLDEMLAQTDVFFLAQKEAQRLFGTDDVETCFAQMQAMGFTGQAVFKRGKNGCIVASGSGQMVAPGYPASPYDTVGSGDIFGASYCYARLCGWGTEKSAAFAAAYTAKSIGIYTDIKQFPPVATVEQLLMDKKTGDGNACES